MPEDVRRTRGAAVLLARLHTITTTTTFIGSEYKCKLGKPLAYTTA